VYATLRVRCNEWVDEFQEKRVRFTFDEVKETVKAKINMDLDDVIINAPIMGVLENMEIPQRRRRFNIREDPFELSNRQFIQLFRLNKAAVRNLIEIVEPYLIPQRISAIDYTTKVNIIRKRIYNIIHIEINNIKNNINISTIILY